MSKKVNVGRSGGWGGGEREMARREKGREMDANIVDLPFP